MNILKQVSFGNIDVSFLTSYELKIKTMPPTTLHSHDHGELQVIFEGDIVIEIGDSILSFSKGDAVYIPPKTVHICHDGKKPSKRLTFPVFSNYKKLTSCALSKAFVEELQGEINRENANCFPEYLTFIFARLFNNQYFVNPNPYYQQIISSFFENNYFNQVHISDLAKLLNHSETHTQRVVKKYTGKSFLQYLTEYRIRNAETMHQITGWPYSEIFPYVGYESYAGFYKAKKSLERKKDSSK